MACRPPRANVSAMPERARKLEVLYNSACPVCDAGVKRQQHLMRESTTRGDTSWTDVTCRADALDRAGLTLEQVRRHLYARDADGTLYRGAEAFAALWRETPGLRWLGALISLPVMKRAVLLPGGAAIIAGLGLACALTWAYFRYVAARAVVTAAIPAILVFPAVFFAHPGLRGMLAAAPPIRRSRNF